MIQVTGSGLWSRNRVDAHFLDLDGVLREARRAFGAARVLVDLRQAKVQTAAAADALLEWTSRIYKPVDSVAVVCASSLLTMQIKRQARVYNLRTFRELQPALDWLLACPTDPAAASLADQAH